MSPTEAAESVVWLRAKLANGPRRKNELATEAKGAGLSWSAVESAKVTLGLVLVVQSGAQKTAGRRPLAWATNEQCEELKLDVWKPGTPPAAGKKPQRSFRHFAIQESLRARGQRVMDESHGD